MYVFFLQMRWIWFDGTLYTGPGAQKASERQYNYCSMCWRNEGILIRIFIVKSHWLISLLSIWLFIRFWHVCLFLLSPVACNSPVCQPFMYASLFSVGLVFSVCLRQQKCPQVNLYYFLRRSLPQKKRATEAAYKKKTFSKQVSKNDGCCEPSIETSTYYRIYRHIRNRTSNQMPMKMTLYHIFQIDCLISR